MAQKRMFSKHITNDERFMEMPLSAHALYLHLGMNADDDGFVQPKMVMRMCGAKEDDLKVLIVKGFILMIPNTENVVVITHWKVNNTLKTDRYKESFYKKHMEMLGISDNMTYLPKWKPNGTITEPQVSIGKDSIVEGSIVNTVCDDGVPSSHFKNDIQEDIADNNDNNIPNSKTPHKLRRPTPKIKINDEIIKKMDEYYLSVSKSKGVQFINDKLPITYFQARNTVLVKVQDSYKQEDILKAWVLFLDKESNIYFFPNSITQLLSKPKRLISGVKEEHNF